MTTRYLRYFHSRRLSSAAAFALLLLALPGAQALLIGKLSGAPVLNAPFTANVALSLASGEDVSSDCVHAELYNGEERIDPRTVGVEVQGSGDARVLRVRTTSRLTEPLLTVYVEVGCGSKLSRRYTLFVDPLSNNLPTVADAGEVVQIVPNVSAYSPQNNLGKSIDTAASIRAQAATPGAPRAQPSRRESAPHAARAPEGRRPAAVARAAQRQPAAPSRSRLTLDMEAPGYSLFQVSPELTQTTEMPDEARRRELRVMRDALVAELQGSADPGSFARRVDELQRANQQLSLQLSAAREQARQERAIREAVEAQRYTSGVVYALTAAVGLLLAALAWIGLRRRAPSASESVFGADAIAEVAPAEAAAEAEPSWLNRMLQRKPRGDSDAGAGALLAQGVHQGAAHDGFVDSIPIVRPGQARVPEAPNTVPNRDAMLTPNEQLAVNEVADISQEAEFFMDIGEYERAISLLEQSLDHEHDITPVPQLYLFDLYRKTGKREPYERLRQEFVRQFNASIPQWNEEPGGGRELADYGRAMEAICRDWRGHDIVAKLEALLVDDTRGQRMGFDLPAYRDIIFLHGIAKQLAAEEEGEDLGIDLGLPSTVMQMRAAEPVDFVLPGDDVAEGRESGLRLTPPSTLDVDIDFGALAVEPKTPPKPQR